MCAALSASSSWLTSIRRLPCPSLGIPSSTFHSDAHRCPPALLLLGPPEPGAGCPQTSPSGRDPCGHSRSWYQAQCWRRTGGGGALPAPSSGGDGKGGNMGWPCCAECGSKACGSLRSLHGIIAVCPLIGLPLLDALDVPPVQAGHRPLSHRVLSQHPTRVLRGKSRGKELEQSQASDGPRTSAGSRSHIIALQIHSFKPRANGTSSIPCHGTGQESQTQPPIPGQQGSHRWD